MPAIGWRVVSKSESQVQYLAMSGLTFGWVYADVQSGSPEASGIAADGWRVDRWGICNLNAVPPNGYGSATWTVDPAQPYAAGSTELRLLVTELACYGDNAVGQLETNVAYGATAVTVTAFVRHEEASRPCTAPPATFASVLHLDRPLGVLALVDGGPYPAKTRAANGQPDISQTPQMEVTIPPGPVVSPGCSIVPAVGSPDVCGVNPSAAPSAAVSGGPTPAATFLTYIVKSGDYADKIAANFNLQLWELKMANPQIADLNHIVIGETLNIPDAGQMSRPSAAPSVP
jgi:LysM repeat protein